MIRENSRRIVEVNGELSEKTSKVEFNIQLDKLKLNLNSIINDKSIDLTNKINNHIQSFDNQFQFGNNTNNSGQIAFSPSETLIKSIIDKQINILSSELENNLLLNLNSTLKTNVTSQINLTKNEMLQEILSKILNYDHNVECDGEDLQQSTIKSISKALAIQK